MTQPFWRDKERRGIITCVRCGAELGTFGGGHFYIDKPAHPQGQDFVCAGPCLGKAKKQGGNNDNNKG